MNLKLHLGDLTIRDRIDTEFHDCGSENAEAELYCAKCYKSIWMPWDAWSANALRFLGAVCISTTALTNIAAPLAVFLLLVTFLYFDVHCRNSRTGWGLMFRIFCWISLLIPLTLQLPDTNQGLKYLMLSMAIYMGIVTIIYLIVVVLDINYASNEKLLSYKRAVLFSAVSLFVWFRIGGMYNDHPAIPIIGTICGIIPFSILGAQALYVMFSCDVSEPFWRLEPPRLKWRVASLGDRSTAPDSSFFMAILWPFWVGLVRFFEAFTVLVNSFVLLAEGILSILVRTIDLMARAIYILSQRLWAAVAFTATDLAGIVVTTMYSFLMCLLPLLLWLFASVLLNLFSLSCLEHLDKPQVASATVLFMLLALAFVAMQIGCAASLWDHENGTDARRILRGPLFTLLQLAAPILLTVWSYCWGVIGVSAFLRDSDISRVLWFEIRNSEFQAGPITQLLTWILVVGTLVGLMVGLLGRRRKA